VGRSVQPYLERILPPPTAAGQYTLQIGLYRPPHGPRLTVAGSDRLLLTSIEVEAP